MNMDRFVAFVPFISYSLAILYTGMIVREARLYSIHAIINGMELETVEVVAVCRQTTI